MTTHNLFLLPGDGIGPEVMGQVENIIAWMNKAGIAKFKTDRGLVGAVGAQPSAGRLCCRQPCLECNEQCAL